MSARRAPASERASPHLLTSGHSVVRAVLTPREEPHASSAPHTHRGDTAGRRYQDMSIGEMEMALASRPCRRGVEARDGSGAQTERALLEDNRRLIQEKRERKALARQRSREVVEQMIDQDRRVSEGDKANAIGRRHMQRDLAEYYKAEIAEKEKAKANAYRLKVEGGVDAGFFPFVEGENVNKHREAKSIQVREEMRSFLDHQRAKRPPRTDALRAETSLEHPIKYGSGPEGDGSFLPGDEVAPHMNRHPRFLSRAREHMSRRLHDAHVRKALEDKVLHTQAELDMLTQRRQAEQRQFVEGMQVTDALRADISSAKAEERRRNADFLKSQMEERRDREERERYELHGDVIGYYGPEEKPVQGGEQHRDHCLGLIKQMEVDHVRRATDRDARLRQERRLVDNGLAEMSQDRAKERQKSMLHREVLTTTWKSQQKIKQTMKQLDRL